MFWKFIRLEWKSFTRASSFGANVVMKIFMIIGAVYFGALFLALGFGSFYIIKENMAQDPLVVVSKYALYYMVFDLLMRLFLQKIPVINIRPLLTLPIKRSMIVNFALGKTALSFFNILHAFFFIPFSIMLLINDYNPVTVILWHLGMMALIYCNNFLCVLMNSKDWMFVVLIVLLAGMGISQYYNLFDITNYTSVFYYGLYTTYYMFIIPIALLAGLWYVSYQFFYKNLYLDTGLKGKNEIAETQDYTWLNKFGTLGTFLKNDIKLIRRNKRSKMTIFMSVMFLFYGLLFMTGSIEMYDNSYMKIFAAIFVTGGFMFTFGQFVPSWDSAYYSLMMSQNIQYREYISAKWWLVVIGTAISALLASFYLYFGLDTYLIILAGAVYNIGFNSHLVLLGGAYIKTPIDLASSKQAFGDKKAFNIQGLLLTLPKLVLPIVLFLLGNLISPMAGYGFVAGAGILGFAFRNKVFSMIEKVYKTEKYKTLAAYKQKN
ncbi:DUF5687 family protein [Flavobacterium cerinum]|uniref:Uncharacterized protein n=1 Tax=Flavobacterium cerinum TaxID=2502784 RepID=A0A444H9V9_9FLAO|nr:DUF5687 family protein [Flavobacterium cerinum]RWX00041.1 hypothetical protein EPI11_10890 [Flavobacterium cerinum]